MPSSAEDAEEKAHSCHRPWVQATQCMVGCSCAASKQGSHVSGQPIHQPTHTGEQPHQCHSRVAHLPLTPAAFTHRLRPRAHQEEVHSHRAQLCMWWTVRTHLPRGAGAQQDLRADCYEAVLCTKPREGERARFILRDLSPSENFVVASWPHLGQAPCVCHRQHL